MESGQLFTWQALSAMGGASLLTYLIVQYTKGLIDRFARWLPTDLYAVVIATAILTAAQLAVGADGGDWRIYALALANGFLVAAAAGQMQNKALNPPGAAGKGDVTND
ncbi:MAG: hypothetical protein C6P35_03330 [Cohnella sp.]|uniref:hypothetical protein n=1 Tax=Cohnella sp. TaxID=1883426 RepID=UPI000E389A04|nr:hypothetical protein [Cohnella sp.]REK68014.1 MAG: hypothetical protein C6P35_03330 [Cohnella sp.]